MMKNLSELPQIEKLLNREQLKTWYPRLSRPLVSKIAGEVVDKFRRELLQDTGSGSGQHQDGQRSSRRHLSGQRLNGRSFHGQRRKSGSAPRPPLDDILEAIVDRCRILAGKRIVPVINATGVILHTNLGRSPIPKEVWEQAGAVNRSYSSLEIDLDTGKRGRRGGLVPDLLSLLLKAESVLVVNNNAAAVFLILSILARDREVIVSRGEPVQIGGGFRIPEILSLSGARLVEVGTTNITTVDDYVSAVTPATALVLRVHSSNFRIRGFTAQPSLTELATALPAGPLLIVDEGSGVTTETLPGHQSVRSCLKAGAQLVCFSGDKVLGGPQCGLIAGRDDLVQQLAGNPLLRVFRPGKTIASLLEEHLVRKLNGEKLSIVERVLSLSTGELEKRGQRLLEGFPPDRGRLVASTLALGGGSAPDEHFPSLSAELNLNEPAEATLRRLREQTPPVIGTIAGNRVLLNLATIEPHSLEALKAALEGLLPQEKIDCS